MYSITTAAAFTVQANLPLLQFLVKKEERMAGIGSLTDDVRVNSGKLSRL